MKGLIADIFQSSISDDLINTIWDGGFLDYDVNDVTEETDDLLNDNLFYVDLLSKLRKQLIVLAGQPAMKCSAFWSDVAATEGLARKIMATLVYLIDCSKRNNLTIHMKEASLLAATVYMTMIRIPGSAGFQLFHPVILQKSIDALKIAESFDTKSNCGRRSQSSQSSKLARGSQSSQRTQSGRRKRQGQPEDTLFDEAEDEELVLSDHDILKLKQHLVLLLQALVLFLKFDPLKNHSHLSEAVISLLARLTKVEPSFFASGFDPTVDIQRIHSVCHLAYLGILVICQRNQGTSVAMVSLAFKALEPNLLMFVGQKRDSVAAQSIPRETVMVRDQTLAFVLHLMTEGKENVQQPLYRLIRSIIMSSPDRSEYRAKISQCVLSMMEQTTNHLYCDMCKWLFQLSKYKKSLGRMMSIEILGQLLVTKQFRKVEDSSIDEELLHHSTRSVMLQALLNRCSDKVPSVMAKALAVLASCLNCEDVVISREIRGFITPCNSNRRARQGNSSQSNNEVSTNTRVSTASVGTGHESSAMTMMTESEGANTIQMASGSSLTQPSDATSTQPGTATTFYLTRGFDITLADSEGLVSLIKRRMQFGKAVVRKSALLALESVIKYNDCVNMSEELELMRDHCRDVAVPIRKQAIQCLTQLLLLYSANEDVQMAWLTGVFPAHDDNESSVQEKCWESVRAVILDGVSQSKGTVNSTLAWELCAKVNSSELAHVRGMLHAVCSQLYKRGSLPSHLISKLSSHIDTPQNKEAWMMLSIICPVTSAGDSKTSNAVAAQWLDNSESMEPSVKLYALTMIATLAKYMTLANRKLLLNDLLNKLRAFNVPTKYIKHMVVAVSQVIEVDDQDGQWVTDMASQIEQILTTIIYGDSYDNAAVSLMPQYLITLGDISLHNPNAISSKLIQLVQSIVVVPKLKGRRKPGFISDLADGLLPITVRNSAIVCLGHICIQHELEAKQSIPVLARELDVAGDSRVKRAIVIILCDLCKLYTNAVGPYISNVSTSLKSQVGDVRRSAFVSLTRLLQEDFLKWKGSLFYRFITCIVDDDPSIAELAKQTFIHELSKRNKNIYGQHFVECVYHFNNFTTHRSYNRFPQTEAEKALFSLVGEANAVRRQTIYNFMLDHMVDSQKFTATERLCQDIVSAAVEKELPLDTKEGAAVLLDALYLLQSKNIKLTVTKAATEALIDGSEEITPSQATTAKATAAAVTKIVRKNFVETVIPDIISLKTLLETRHSPIIKHLMLFLIEITKDYKAELADILAGNEQLAAELQFDIRKFEEMEAAAAEEASNQTQEPVEIENNANQADKTLAEVVRTPLRVNGTAGGGVVTPSLLHVAGTPLQPYPHRTPLQSALPGTPGPRALSGTPSMPPPPLRSALKKPMTATKRLLDSAKKMARDREQSSGGSRGIMTKRVNFDEGDEDELEENTEVSNDLSLHASMTPLRTIVSGAVGARAISTPAGHLTDLTFAYNNTSLSRSLSPIVMLNNIMGDNGGGGYSSERSQSARRVRPIPSDPLTSQWNIRSPAPQQNTKSRKTRPPPPEDGTPVTGINDDLLEMLPLSTKPIGEGKRRRSGRKRK